MQCSRHNLTPCSSLLPRACHFTLSMCDTNAVSYTSWQALSSRSLPLLLLIRCLQVIHSLLLSFRGLGTSLISSGTLRKRTVQRKPSMPPICLPSITPRGLSQRRKSTSAANGLVLWWATLRKWTVQLKSSMPPIRLLSITLRGSSKRRKSTSVANCFAFWWAYSLAPRAPTGRHKSTSAAHLLESWCSTGGWTEKHKSPMPLLCWSSLGHTRALRKATGRRKSTSAANLLQPQRPQEALTERHKTLMPPICWAVLGQSLTPRGLTGRHKSTSVANLLRPWCPQVVPTERLKSSTLPICWLLSGLLLPLRSATVKQKSLKAADLLQSRWASAPITVRRKSRRAARLLGAPGHLIFLDGYSASDLRSRMGRQSHCAWSGWPSEKMPHRRAVLHAGRRRGTNDFISGTGFLEKLARNHRTFSLVESSPSFNFAQLLSCKPTYMCRTISSALLQSRTAHIPNAGQRFLVVAEAENELHTYTFISSSLVALSQYLESRDDRGWPCIYDCISHS